MHLASGRIPLDVGLPAFHASSSWFSVNRDERGLCRKRPGPHRHPGASGGGVYALDQGYQRGMLVRNSSRSTSWVGPVSIRYCQATVLPAQPGLKAAKPGELPLAPALMNEGSNDLWND